jgi:hypothetical protein
MKYLSLFLLFIISSCEQKQINCNPDTYLSKTEQDSFNYKIIRYIQRLPKYATEENKFDTQFDVDYKNSLKDCSLLFYYVDKENTIYFAVSKTAPSIKLKQTATVGKLNLAANGSITYYEEVFRTWKMEPNELATKTKMLFTKFIKNEDLSDYYTINSNPEFYIEFPDDINYYDIKLRKWETKK